jgi:hypothetical protein
MFIDQLDRIRAGKKSTPHPVDFVILPALEGPINVRIRALPSVQDDWCAWLPQDKAQAFDECVHQLESVYTMFSIALNEAMEYRQSGMVAKSYQAVCMTPGLATRLSHQLAGLLRGLGGHAKHFGTIPNTAPLDPANFQGAKEQRTARMSDLLSRVLLTQRSQFLHKINILEEMVGDLGKDFRLTVENLSSGGSARPEADWRAVDTAHYDLNTCLRETIVLLKSFLVVLPQDQLGTFQKTVHAQTHSLETPSPSGDRQIRHRRMAAVGGE